MEPTVDALSKMPAAYQLQMAAEATEREAAFTAKRARQARDKATGRTPLVPGCGSPAYWMREAARLEDLARREAEKATEARQRYEATLADPEPF